MGIPIISIRTGAKADENFQTIEYFMDTKNTNDHLQKLEIDWLGCHRFPSELFSEAKK